MQIRNFGAASLAVMVLVGLNIQPAKADWRDNVRAQKEAIKVQQQQQQQLQQAQRDAQRDQRKNWNQAQRNGNRNNYGQNNFGNGAFGNFGGKGRQADIASRIQQTEVMINTAANSGQLPQAQAQQFRAHLQQIIGMQTQANSRGVKVSERTAIINQLDALNAQLVGASQRVQ